MKKLSTSLFVFTILLTACQSSPQETMDGTDEETDETSINRDASEWYFENPSTGDMQYAKRFVPDSYFDDPLPTIVLVPGGGGDSRKFEDKRNSAQDLANDGYVVITFDPLGHNNSEGADDFYGYADQDGLNELINSLDSKHIGLVTYSYGITMGSGMLARYPDSPVEFLIDYEGPADRTDTGGCDASKTGHIKTEDCNDEEYWKEREAVTFLKEIEVPYHRIQSNKDHAQPDFEHTLKLMNSALESNSDWVKINDGELNAVYEAQADLPLIEINRTRPLMEIIAEYADELFALPQE